MLTPSELSTRSSCEKASGAWNTVCRSLNATLGVSCEKKLLETCNHNSADYLKKDELSADMLYPVFHYCLVIFCLFFFFSESFSFRGTNTKLSSVYFSWGHQSTVQIDGDWIWLGHWWGKWVYRKLVSQWIRSWYISIKLLIILCTVPRTFRCYMKQRRTIMNVICLPQRLSKRDFITKTFLWWFSFCVHRTVRWKKLAWSSKTNTMLDRPITITSLQR